MGWCITKTVLPPKRQRQTYLLSGLTRTINMTSIREDLYVFYSNIATKCMLIHCIDLPK